VEYSLEIPTFVVWGSNTGVGKSLVSAALCRAAAVLSSAPFLYLKPVQTGFPLDSDARLVARVTGNVPVCGPHAQQLLDGTPPPPPSASPQSSSSLSVAKTLFAWAAPVSPHEAMRREGRVVSDSDILRSVIDELNRFSSNIPNHHDSGENKPMCLIETAGGVCSPGPSGRLLSHVLRPLRLPGVLVADSRLGGISATLSALDSLALRGYDTAAVVIPDAATTEYSGTKQSSPHGLGNADAIEHFLSSSSSSLTSSGISGGLAPRIIRVPALPALPDGEGVGRDATLEAWLVESQSAVLGLRQVLLDYQWHRLERARKLGSEAKQILWWPFTQHSSVGDGDITTIDSRYVIESQPINVYVLSMSFFPRATNIMSHAMMMMMILFTILFVQSRGPLSDQ